MRSNESDQIISSYCTSVRGTQCPRAPQLNPSFRGDTTSSRSSLGSSLMILASPQRYIHRQRDTASTRLSLNFLSLISPTLSPSLPHGLSLSRCPSLSHFLSRPPCFIFCRVYIIMALRVLVLHPSISSQRVSSRNRGGRVELPREYTIPLAHVLLFVSSLNPGRAGCSGQIQSRETLSLFPPRYFIRAEGCP